MLIENRVVQMVSESQFTSNFNLCFKGFNLTGALLALAAIRSGMKVVIVVEQPLSWKFDPEIVALYPLRFRKMFQSIRNIRYFENISSLFPSLIYPQRILVVSEKRKFHSKAATIIDFFLKRDRDIASLPVNFTKYPSFQILKNQFLNGLLVQEFRFDRNMAIIEILRMCKKSGAVIVSDFSALKYTVGEKSVFACLSANKEQRELKIENFRLGFSNNIWIETEGFEITSIVRETNTHLYFLKKRECKQDDFVNHVLTILRSLGIESPERYKTEIVSIFNHLEKINVSETNNRHQLYDSDIQEIEKKCRQVAMNISNAVGKNIQFNRMIKSLRNNRLDGNSFRRLQTECDEKFDLAKQTGIEYERFCYYFYRYRQAIDDFIESAYQKMNSHRSDHQRLWETVEQEFKDKIEAELFS